MSLGRIFRLQSECGTEKFISAIFSGIYIYIYVYTNTEELDYTLYYELTYMYPSLKNSYEQRV